MHVFIPVIFSCLQHVIYGSRTDKVNKAVLPANYTVSQKNIPDIFDCNLKTNYRILIIFGRNIPDTTCHQITVQFPTSPNVCFYTTLLLQIKCNMCWNKHKSWKKHPWHYRS